MSVIANDGGPIPTVRPDLDLDEVLAYLVDRLGKRRAAWHLAADLDLELQASGDIGDDEYHCQSAALQAIIAWAAQDDE